MEWRTPAPKRRSVGFIEPCIPTQAASPPVGAQWIHEIKHDGYRLMVSRRGGRVRLFTRRGYDWTERYPLIRAAAEKLAIDATIDGEAVVCNSSGIADFEKLHSRDNDGAAFLYAFDLLEANGVDLRLLALEQRKDHLRKLLERWPVGIHFNDHIEADGATVFAHACKLGCEGIVSKDRSRPYQSGRTKIWLKVKNPAAPAVTRFEERDAMG